MSMLHLYDDSETDTQDYQAWEDMVADDGDIHPCDDCWQFVAADCERVQRAYRPILCRLHQEAYA